MGWKASNSASNQSCGTYAYQKSLLEENYQSRPLSKRRSASNRKFRFGYDEVDSGIGGNTENMAKISRISNKCKLSV